MISFWTHKEYAKIISMDIIPTSFDDIHLAQQYLTIILGFCFI